MPGKIMLQIIAYYPYHCINTQAINGSKMNGMIPAHVAHPKVMKNVNITYCKSCVIALPAIPIP